MDRLAIIQEQKIVETKVRFEEKTETMDRLAMIQEEKIVQSTVTFSASRKH